MNPAFNNITTDFWKTLLNIGIEVTMPVALDCAQKSDIQSLQQLLKAIDDHPNKNEFLNQSTTEMKTMVKQSNGKPVQLLVEADIFMVFARALNSKNGPIEYKPKDLSAGEQALIQQGFQVFGKAKQHEFVQALVEEVNSKDLVSAFKASDVQMDCLFQPLQSKRFVTKTIAANQDLEEITPYEMAVYACNLETANAIRDTANLDNTSISQSLELSRNDFTSAFEEGMHGGVGVDLDMSRMLAYLSEIPDKENNRQFLSTQDFLRDMYFGGYQESHISQIKAHHNLDRIASELFSRFGTVDQIEIFEQLTIHQLPENFNQKSYVEQLLRREDGPFDIMFGALLMASSSFLKVMGPEGIKTLIESGKSGFHKGAAESILPLFHYGFQEGQNRAPRFLECAELLSQAGYDPAHLLQGKEVNGQVIKPQTTGLQKTMGNCQGSDKKFDDFIRFVAEIEPHGFVPQAQSADGKTELSDMNPEHRLKYEPLLRSINAKNAASDILSEMDLGATAKFAKPI